MFGKKSDNRFETTYSQGKISVTRILVDRETGVNYLFVSDGSSAGLTLLVDREGNPIISRVEDNTTL
ncbi:DUF6440 family protein [Acidaminobacter hydrogenoformans]|uniref:DUF6440 domain-containing protein n=1 Tax=Acidaminobacter hydrogenoformans DSM 2784 TaxID=1120920 RepID=A0A1G5S601_9FIRM|nr:DUF6440 family protein [Acidaminobacter hydrogenoformans]SCZ81774.1 hypothetical protein SAMN03080599_03015 [Acidaminobacter hydrogenoformans DSM 2784]